MAPPEASVASSLMDRRTFVRICSVAAAAIGLPSSAVARMVSRLEGGARPSVIWLSFQECTGCTETLLRTSHPGLDELILDLVSLDYHEALCAGAGHQAEAARLDAMDRNRGGYVLVVEGAIPMADGGIYCQIGGRTAVELARETAADAGLVLAVGSCASWGGISSAPPNPTGATGLADVLGDRTVVSIPGCPPNPYNFLGTVLQFATFGTLPELDDLGRPRFAYGRTIHEHCPRRPHFDEGRFARAFGDEDHREGHCLYLLGCKGPWTHANCSTRHYCEVDNAWPIGIGSPCFGCTEADLAFTVPAFTVPEIGPSERPLLPGEAPMEPPATGGIHPVVAGAVGLAAGSLTTLGVMEARRGRDESGDET